METIEVAPDATRDPDARRTRDLLAAHIAYTRWRAIRCWMVGIAIAVGAAEMLFTACGLMAGCGKGRGGANPEQECLDAKNTKENTRVPL